MKLKYTAIIIMLLSVSIGYSQDSWFVQFRPGLHIPLNDLGEENLELGFGFDVRIGYKLMPHLKTYAGWGLSLFETEQNAQRDKTRLRENSFQFGAELQLPFEQKTLAYYVYAGGVLGSVRLEDTMKTFNSTSDFGLGWQVGAGAELALDDKWSLKPDLRYRSLHQELTIGENTIDINLDYLSIALGLFYTF